MSNFERYCQLHDELMRRLEDGEITTEQSKEVNSKIFDKYIIEASYDRKIDKHVDAAITKVADKGYKTSKAVESFHPNKEEIPEKKEQVQNAAMELMKKINDLGKQAKYLIAELPKTNDKEKQKNIKEKITSLCKQIDNIDL